MNELNEPVPDSAIVHTLEEAEKFIKEIGYPVIVRPAFTMGGTGGGICYNDEDLQEIVPNGFKLFTSSSMFAWKINSRI